MACGKFRSEANHHRTCAPLQVDFALLDVIGPYPASVHSYDIPTRTWKAAHASVSIEKAPFHGDAMSEFRCYKVYQADDRGHIRVCVGKEGRLMSQNQCHEQVLRQLCMEQCIKELVRTSRGQIRIQTFLFEVCDPQTKREREEREREGERKREREREQEREQERERGGGRET